MDAPFLARCGGLLLCVTALASPLTGQNARSVTSHEIPTADGPLRYTATAGYFPLEDDEGSARGEVFFVAYEVEDGTRRPVTFAFNGGPGQPAVWLHLGIGPMRAVVSQPAPNSSNSRFDAATEIPPPYGDLVANPDTWLTATDVVFVDPISTGYSRAADGVDPSEFHGYAQDVEYLGEFIRSYLGEFQRWHSPKFLVGESYGTTRVSGLSHYLLDRHGIALNGVILVSGLLNWQTARFHVGNDLPHILFLPTYTATAWYHGLLAPGLQRLSLGEVVRRAEQFATSDYALALLQGDALQPEARERIVDRLSELTGLSPAYVRASNLRVDARRFAKELRRGERLTVGRLDSRYTGLDRDAAGEVSEYDPGYFIYGPYTALFNRYVRETLGFESTLPYEIRAGDLVRPWDYGTVQNRYLNVAEHLRRAMSENPALRLFVASGYYDLATPFFAMDYTLRHMHLDERLRGNVEVRHYEAGHMMYIRPESLALLAADVRDFYRRSVRTTHP